MAKRGPHPAVVFVLVLLVGAAAAWWHFSRNYTLYYGDSLAHLTIARRLVDSRTAGLDQIGTVWLPLPHLLMLPFARNDDWWFSGYAGAMVGVPWFALACAFLFAAVRRLFQGSAPAWVAVLILALNPNVLYLQSIPMTEPMMLASLMALLYATVWFRGSGSWGAVLLATVASNAASLTRYEGWFLIPFVALYFLFGSKKPGLARAATFALIASAAPLAWLAHNWWYFGSALEFYNGPYSAKAIQGAAAYPGKQDWAKAWDQYSAAATLCAGQVAVWLGLAGVVAALFKRAFWPLILLALPVGFYVWSLHSSGTPIFVPNRWPNSYYNTRYGLTTLPLLALGAASLVALLSGVARSFGAAAVVVSCALPWALYPNPNAWVTWKESEVNSATRRAWTHEAAEFFRHNWNRGEGIYSSLGDQAGIFREAGIPFRYVLHEGNQPLWDAVNTRPDLFLWEEWVVAIRGDAVSRTMARRKSNAARYECVKIVGLTGSPVIEIYRRVHEDSIH